MECNRDDALKATQLAEKKLAMRDLAAAKKFALKAMHLFPALDRAKQMLLVVEVHAAAELKCDDWYGILQVDPVADFDSIKKQFRKLALQLHPDKNNLQGAEQAFKLINEAWGVLSDKEQRAVYDVKRNGSTEVKPTSNGYNHASAASSDSCKVHQQRQSFPGREQGSTAPPPSSSQSHAPRQGATSSNGGTAGVTSSNQGPRTSTQAQETFWTQCPKCRVQYQYYRTYENAQLLCQRCKEGFVAKDMDKVDKPTKDKQQESDLLGGARVKSRVNGVKSEQFLQMMQQKAREREEKRRQDEQRKMEREKEREEKRRMKEVLRKLKEEEKRREALERQMQKQREREEKEARKKSMEALKKKLKRSRMIEEDDDDDDDEEDEEEEEEISAAQAAALGLRRSYRTRRNVVYRDDYEEEEQASKKARTEDSNLSEEELAFRKHLAEKGRQYVLKALSVILKYKSDLVSETQKVAAPEVVKEEQGVQATQGEACPAVDVNAKAAATPTECVQNQNCSEVPPSTSSDETGSDAVFFVPDSDFYDFDKDRREEDVQEGQIWALYDDADGMPRFYCEIKQIVSLNPFKLRIRWLEQHQPSEVEQKWQEAGFQLTCGRFKLAKRAKPEDQINKFSHAMMASRVQGNVVRVYPVKGEVWALYRDWSMEWLEQGIDAEAASRGGYEMVEVVADGSWAAASEASSGAGEVEAEEEREEIFVTVVSLVKVQGFKTIFARGQGAEKTFKRQELPRFSHRVPAHWMTGEEKPNAPKDCWQLDTAAMPSQLINGTLETETVLA